MTVIVVAEVGSNFTPSDLDSALAMVRTAHASGANVAKFQDFRVDGMDRPQWWKDKCRPWELGEGWPAALASEARLLGMDFACSVWDDRSIIRALRLGYPALKVAAGEIGNQPLLRSINRASADRLKADDWALEVWLSVDYRRHRALVPALTWLPDCAVTLMHCVSEYPAENFRSHWSDFLDLQQYGMPVGLSSHFPHPESLAVASRGVRWGVTVVEAHLRTEATPEDAPDNGPWALYPSEFQQMVEAVRRVEDVDH